MESAQKNEKRGQIEQQMELELMERNRTDQNCLADF